MRDEMKPIPPTGCYDEQGSTVQMLEKYNSSFEAHVENGEILVDECEGVDSEAGISLFDPWMWEMLGAKRKV